VTVISFLSDFGLQDDFVGTCHGVIARIAPDVRVIDVTHGIAPQAVLQGALVLRHTLEYFPLGISLAVVDPGVGSSRRPVAVRTRDGRTLVGPDNGLLSLAADACGIESVHELADPRFRLERVSRTFHGRDVFAPAAAHVAAGVPVAELGPAVDPADLVRLDVPEPDLGRSQLSGSVVVVDRFGNVATNVRRDHLDALGLEVGSTAEIRIALDRYYAVLVETFADADAGELILYEDSYGLVTLAISRGSAGRLTGARPGDELRIALT
jgi:S-adenosyl-L-methionine hydrolase (adenosine-forming)